MGARTIQDQMAVLHDVTVADTARRDAGMSHKPVRKTRIHSSDIRWDDALEPTVDEFSEIAYTSPLPVLRGGAEDLMRVLRQLEVIAKLRPARIAFRTKGNILFLNLADIAAVQAEGNYVSLRHRTHPYLVHESLSSMAEKLKPYGFIRIHRSVVVNASAVEEMQPLPTGEYRLRVKGGKEYLATRTYKHNLRDLAQLWVGSERFPG